MKTVALSLLLPLALTAQVTALRIGHLVDPEAGTIATNQIVLVENGKFTAIGANLPIPAGAEVIDMSSYYVTPGLVDAHNHLALTYKMRPRTTPTTSPPFSIPPPSAPSRPSRTASP